MNRSDGYIRNSIWGLLNKIVSILLPFLVRTVLIYKLGVEYVGVNGLFSTILQVLSLAELGFGSAFVVSMYEPIANKDIDSLCALLKLYRLIYRIIGIIIFVLGAILTPFLPFFISGSYPDGINIYIIYIVYLLNTVCSYLLFSYKASLLNAYQRTDIRNKITMMSNCILYILQIVVLVAFSNYYFYIILLPVATIFNNLLATYRTKRMYPRVFCRGGVDKAVKDKIKMQVISLMWHKLGNTIIFSFDNIVISAFLGLKILGIYNNYFYIYNSVASLFSIFYEAITPGLGNSLIVESKNKNYNDFNDFNTINFCFIGFCSSCLICLYQPFMNVWQGQDLMCETSIPVLLTILFVIWHSRRMIHTYKDAAGLWEIDRYRPIAEALVNLTLNLIMVKVIGLEGIVLSTIIAMIMIGIPWETTVFIKGYFQEKLSDYYCVCIKNLAKILVVCLLSYLACSLIDGRGVLAFALKILICSLTSIILLYALYRRERGYNRIKEILIRKLVK